MSKIGNYGHLFVIDYSVIDHIIWNVSEGCNSWPLFDVPTLSQGPLKVVI